MRYLNLVFVRPFTLALLIGATCHAQSFSAHIGSPALKYALSSRAHSLAPSSLFAPIVAYSTGAMRPNAVAVVDVNGDGKPDLVVTNGCADTICVNGGAISVLSGNGDGTFQTATTFNSGIYVGALAVADLNG